MEDEANSEPLNIQHLQHQPVSITPILSSSSEECLSGITFYNVEEFIQPPELELREFLCSTNLDLAEAYTFLTGTYYV